MRSCLFYFLWIPIPQKELLIGSQMSILWPSHERDYKCCCNVTLHYITSVYFILNFSSYSLCTKFKMTLPNLCHPYASAFLLNSLCLPYLKTICCIIKCTGVSGIVRQGLNHVAIPRGWVWGGPASEHCPVWCELFTWALCGSTFLAGWTNHKQQLPHSWLNSGHLWSSPRRLWLELG